MQLEARSQSPLMVQLDRARVCWVSPQYFPLSVLSDPWEDPFQNVPFKEWNGRFPLVFDECLECPAISICGGGCPLASPRDRYDLGDRSADMRSGSTDSRMAHVGFVRQLFPGG